MASPTNEDAGRKADAEKASAGVAQVYDVMSKIWVETVGEHFHIGFYETSSTASVGTDVRSAQIRMIEEALRFASISEEAAKKPKHILDVGCGTGGSTRYLARKYDAECKGITISPVEVERARVLTAEQGLENQVSFEVVDAVNQPFPDGQFDLVWCVECADHVADKQKLVEELARVATPGGKIVLLTWCHRDLSPSEQDLLPDEKKILDAFYADNPCKWCSIADYVDLLKSFSLRDIKHSDWSRHVNPHFAAARKLTWSWKGIWSYIRHTGFKHLHLKVLTLPSPLENEKIPKGLLKYCIITCRKPE